MQISGGVHHGGTTCCCRSIILLRPFNNIPDIHHAEWAKFGFCYCTSFAQREALASAYVHLVDANTPLSDVVHAWTTSS